MMIHVHEFTWMNDWFAGILPLYYFYYMYTQPAAWLWKVVLSQNDWKQNDKKRTEAFSKSKPIILASLNT